MRTDSSDSRQMPMNHHKCDKLIGVVVVCMLLAGIMLCAIVSTSRSKWHCSPSQLRSSGAEAWEEVTTPARSHGEPNEDFYASFTVTSDEQNFIVEHPPKNTADSPFDFEVRKMTPGESVDIGGGTLALCAVGAAYLDPGQTMEDDAE